MFNGAGVFVGHLSPFVIFAALGTETGAVSPSTEVRGRKRKA